jgi:enoyl-CoA hydratase
MVDGIVHLVLEGPVAVVRIDRERKLNAMDNLLTELLYEKIREGATNAKVRALIITGSGRAFSVGSDIEEYKKMEKVVQYAEHQRLGRLLYDYVENLDKPVIAAVNGYCLGGGLELALACDLVIATPDAKFGDPTLKLGVVPGGGTTQKLTRLIGKNKTKELLFTGTFLDAEAAKSLGLVNLIVSSEHLLEEAKKLAMKTISMAPLSIAKAKKLVNEGAESPLAVALSYEIEATIALFGTEDAKEGLKAFVEKREPKFKGA